MSAGSALPIEAKGVNGTVIFDGQAIAIRRKGMMARATVGKGDKMIPVASVTAVQFKPAGMVRGFIQFTVPGGNENRSRFGKQSIDSGQGRELGAIRRHAEGRVRTVA